MNAMTMAAAGDRSRVAARIRATWPSRAMVAAEFLKVRRRRALVTGSVLLTVGTVVVVFAVLAGIHARDPSAPSAGGLAHLSQGLGFLWGFGGLATVLAGVVMGAGDIHAGVFRDLVVTGRSRIALFAARVPGGLALLWSQVLVAWVVACAASAALAGHLAVPSPGLVIRGGLWVLLATGSLFALALGVGSLIGSQAVGSGVVIAWQAAAAPLLIQVHALGPARQLLPVAALDRLTPAGLRFGTPDPVGTAMPLWVAVAVLAGWILVPLVAGAWRTATRDA
jgi:hypothetical protein